MICVCNYFQRLFFYSQMIFCGRLLDGLRCPNSHYLNSCYLNAGTEQMKKGFFFFFSLRWSDISQYLNSHSCLPETQDHSDLDTVLHSTVRLNFSRSKWNFLVTGWLSFCLEPCLFKLHPPPSSEEAWQFFHWRPLWSNLATLSELLCFALCMRAACIIEVCGIRMTDCM